VPQPTELVLDELTSPSSSDESATELPTTFYPSSSQTSNGDDDDASKFISGVSRLFQHFQSLSSNVTPTTNMPNVTLPTFRTSLIPQDQALANSADMSLTSSVCLWFGEVLPCKCTPNYDPDGALVGLNCRNSSLTDSSVNEILDALLAKPNSTSLSHLYLSENNLTRVPDQVKLFAQLKSVDLSDNRIAAIQSGAFESHQQQMMIFLNGNHINRIEPEAFQG
jgi:Leucine-rich repeat (LRR) protein